MKLSHTLRLINHVAILATISLFIISLIGFLGDFFWVIDLLSHFRLQYSLVFLFFIAWFIITRRPAYLTLATIGLLTNLLVILPYFFQPHVNALTNKSLNQTKVIMSNINYGNTDHSALISLIQEEKPQIVAVIELLPPEYESLSKELISKYPYQFNIEGRSQLGIALFSQLPFNENPQAYYWSDKDHPTLITKLGHNNNELLTLIVAHPPPPLTAHYSQIRNNIFAGIAQYTSRVKSPLMVIGDFNNTSWSPHFQDLLSNGGLIDTRNNRGLQTTWPTQLPTPFRISIDHALVNNSVEVLDRDVLSNVGSDHLPIVVEIAW